MEERFGQSASVAALYRIITTMDIDYDWVYKFYYIMYLVVFIYTVNSPFHDYNYWPKYP